MNNKYKWDIDTTHLLNYKCNMYDTDEFIITNDNKYGILFYNIVEGSMCAYYGKFAIYEKANLSQSLINIDKCKQFIWYRFDKKSFDYGELSNCLIFNFSAYKENSKKPTMPYLFIKPFEKQFALPEWEFTSISHGFKEISKDKFEIYEKNPIEITNIQNDGYYHAIKTGMTIDLNELKWHNTKYLDEAYNIYHKL